MLRSRPFPLASLFVTLLAVGCGGDALTSPVTPPATATLQISTSTQGSAPDPDGYTVTVDGADHGNLAGTAAMNVDGLAAGDHAVGISGVAANCQVQGDNPRTVPITSGTNASVTFSVACTTPPSGAGTLRVITATTGAGLDPDGYAFAVDGGTSQPIGVNATASLANVAGGIHSVTLTRLSSNCTAQTPNPHSVTVSAGAAADVSFAISCGAIGETVKVSVTTTGSPSDPDGYVAQLDSKDPGLPVTVNGSATFAGVPPGAHTVELSGVASSCKVMDGALKNVTVNVGASVETSFSVTCGPQGVVHWSPMDGGAGASFAAVWGTGPNDVFAVGTASDGNAAVFHYDGAKWAPQFAGSAGTFPAVWASSPSDVYAAANVLEEGAFASIYHYNGANWSPMARIPTENNEHAGFAILFALWGLSANQVFAVGTYERYKNYAPLILRFDGTAWQPFPSPPLEGSLVDVWGSSANDLYVTALRWDANNPGYTAAVLFHYDGTTWAAVKEKAVNALGFIWGSAVNDVVANLDPSSFLHYNGKTWSEKRAPTSSRIHDIWGVSTNDVFAVAGRDVLHYDGASWSSTATSATQDLNAIWGSSATDVFAVANGGTILHGTR